VRPEIGTQVLMYQRTEVTATQGAVLGMRRDMVTRAAVSSLMMISDGATSQVLLSRACGLVPGVSLRQRSEVGLSRGRRSWNYEQRSGGRNPRTIPNNAEKQVALALYVPRKLCSTILSFKEFLLPRVVGVVRASHHQACSSLLLPRERLVLSVRR
jgi:hypothetical protein